MREKFFDIYDKLNNNKELSKSDYMILYTGALTTKETMQKNVNREMAVIAEYENNLIPKLFEISKANDMDAKILVENYFNKNLTETKN